jgi:hypothetical protein
MKIFVNNLLLAFNIKAVKRLEISFWIKKVKSFIELN